MILVIAEKPDLGKAIAAATPGGGTYIGKEQIIKTSFHGEEMVICWCAGHFLTLKDPEFSPNPGHKDRQTAAHQYDQKEQINESMLKQITI